MKKMFAILCLFTCLQFQYSYAVGNEDIIKMLLSISKAKGSGYLAKIIAEQGAKKGYIVLGTNAAKGVGAAVGASTAKAGAATAGAEAATGVAKEATKGLWGSVAGACKGIGISIGVDLLCRGASAGLGWLQARRLRNATEALYDAIGKNAGNEINEWGLPRGCEKEIKALLKVGGGVEMLQKLSEIYQCVNKGKKDK